MTDYVEGLGAQEIAGLPDAERDRVGELVFRFYFGLAWRDGIVAGDPHADNCMLCPDGRVCLLDFGLLRELEPDYVEGERAVMQAIADGDAQGVHDGLSRLGYLPDPDARRPRRAARAPRDGRRVAARAGLPPARPRGRRSRPWSWAIRRARRGSRRCAA